ncbi:hypothetical protein, partial [uncultured Algoriphagus sp.]|uniref:hypothetical protein n=1 Tax=uncultured Algoriphagus sp. TaxID=417365 RepID=UPI0025946C0E
MAKLSYKKVNHPGSGRFDLLASAKIKELIEFYGISMPLTFVTEWEEWAGSLPRNNAYSFADAYRCKLTEQGTLIQIWKHFMGSAKDPVLVYEIRVVEDQVTDETAS